MSGGEPSSIKRNALCAAVKPVRHMSGRMLLCLVFFICEEVKIVYQALYRKWRPQVFSDVAGQPHVTVTLKNEIQAGRFSHAYLFTGSRGTGKTTCAKIFAKAVNCLHPVDGDPCNECEICRGIDSGAILDVTEIDAASNNGVENIRDLREEVNFTPSSCAYRVYIIDEVHMLSISAFNALLKTLEEPPSHVLFILATTEVHKLPATILSRCQRFDFRRIAAEAIAERLQYVAQQEGAQLEEDGALYIARLSDGALRDALSLLDQCIGRGEAINADVVASVAGLAARDYLFELSAAVGAQDTEKVLTLIDRLHQGSCDMERLCGELIQHFRNYMIMKTVKDPGSLLVASPAELARMREEVSALPLERILGVLDILQETQARLHSGANGRVEMEMAMIRLASPKLESSMPAVLDRISRLELMIKSGKIPEPVREEKKAPLPETSPEPKKASLIPEVISAVTPPASQSVVQAPPAPPPASVPTAPLEQEEPPQGEAVVRDDVLLKEWPEVLEQLKKIDVSVLSILSDSRAYRRGNFILIDSPNVLFSEFIKRKGYAVSIRKAVSQVTGTDYKLGIYKRPETSAGVRSDPLQMLEQRARNMGIDVTIEE